MIDLKKLEKVRTELFLKDSYLGYIFQKIEIDFSDDMPTAATNGRIITIGIDFFNKTSVYDLSYVVAHEILHIFLNHPKRSRRKNTFIYNIAADIVVNDILKRYFKKPNLAIIYGKGNISGTHLSTEEIYEYLIKNIDQVDLTYVIDNHEQWKEGDEIDRSIINEIYQYKTKSPSFSLTNNIIHSRDFIMHVKPYLLRKNWRDILRDYIVNKTYDYSYKRVDLRYKDFLLPKYYESGAKLENIWMVIDVSGSVNNKELTKIVFQIIDIFKQFREFNVLISFFSTIVTKPINVNSIKQFKQMLDKIKSTYGTNFEIIFNYVAKSNIKPLALLIITDGYAKCPGKNILNQTDVIWILTNDISGKKKFGKHIYI